MKAFIALLVLALVVGTFWWVRDTTPIAAPSPAVPAEVVTPQSATTTTPVRVEIPDAATATERAPSVVVRVVDADDRAVSQVLVRYGLRFASERRELLTDARGEATWPIGEQLAAQWFVTAVREGEYAEATISAPKPGEVTILRLAPDFALTVRVLEPDGVGARDVGVLVRGDGRLRHLGRTDAEGRLDLTHVQIWRQFITQEGARAVEIAVDWPDVEAPGVRVDLTRPPSEPVVLRLPPTGSLRVEVQDAFGQPDPRFDRVGLGTTNIQRTGLDHGIATFTHLPLGRCWSITATCFGVEPVQQDADGPRVAGEAVTVVLRGKVAPVLTGRLLRQGAPLASTGVGVEILTAEHTRPFTSPVRTDVQGRFRLPLTPDWKGRTAAVTFAVVHGEDREVAALAPRTLEPIEYDLGDLELQPEPVLVAGRLVGEGDFAEVNLWIESSIGDGGAWQRVSDVHRQVDGRFRAYGSAPPTPLRLHVLAPAHVAVAPIPFAPGTIDLEVVLVRGGSVEASVVLPAVPLFLGLAPRLRADDRTVNLIADARFASRGPIDGNGLDHALPCMQRFRHGEPTEVVYVWRGLPPGRYHLSLFAWGSPRAILEIRDIEVPADGTAADARLQGIELPSVRSVKLTLRGLAPFDYRSNWPSPTVFYLDGERVDPNECTSIDSDHVYLLAPRPLDLLVRVDGFRDLELHGVFEDRDIELEPGPELRLHVECGDVSLPEGCVLEVELAAGESAFAGGEGPWINSAAAGSSVGRYRQAPLRASFDGAGDATVRVSRVGGYDVALFARGSDGRRLAVGGSPSMIEVGATNQTPVVLRPDPAQLRAVVETLLR